VKKRRERLERIMARREGEGKEKKSRKKKKKKGENVFLNGTGKAGEPSRKENAAKLRALLREWSRAENSAKRSLLLSRPRAQEKGSGVASERGREMVRSYVGGQTLRIKKN